MSGGWLGSGAVQEIWQIGGGFFLVPEAKVNRFWRACPACLGKTAKLNVFVRLTAYRKTSPRWLPRRSRSLLENGNHGGGTPSMVIHPEE
jgi:hypothetical protein